MNSSSSNTLILTGSSLTIQDIDKIVKDAKVSVLIADSTFSNMENSRKFLEQEMGKRVIYGVNTGFGPMASHIISEHQTVSLQKNLVRSHAAGIGNPLPEEYVLAAMVIRLNTLIQGYSGVSRGLIEQLQAFVNHRIIPIVPEHGAVGTSGDLVQLAHIALALMGEGEAVYRGQRQATAKILTQLQLQPYELKAKEGLSLINGTSMMTAVAAVLCTQAEHLLSVAVRLGAYSLEIVRGYDDSISEQLHKIRPHSGQVQVAKAMRELLASSHMLRRRDDLHQPSDVNGENDVVKIPDKVQEFYSIRCTPQILGPVLDTLSNTWRVVEVEMNSTSDNPVVDWERGFFLHGGNFHGDYIAAVIDQLKMTLVKLTMLSERRINFFLSSHVNGFFPPFLNLQTPGLTLALQGLQFVATSTTAQNQTLAFPHYVHSIPTNADNQDVVSMGTDAALFAAKVIENAYVVLAIELITIAQAVDFLGEQEKLSYESKKLYDDIRSIFPVIKEDRVLVHELPDVTSYIKKSQELSLSLSKSNRI